MLLSKFDETGIGSPTSGKEIPEAQSFKKQTTSRRKKVAEELKNRRGTKTDLTRKQKLRRNY